MENDVVQNLLKISVPKQFAAGEYIFYEGDVGDEMYIVLKGAVELWTDSPLEGSILITTVTAGGFFGEMAIFDTMPRSAAAVTLEDTVCCGINKEKMPSLITTCPDIIQQMLVNMSLRVREMDEMLYKAKRLENPVRLQPFALPQAHRAGEYRLDMPSGSGRFLSSRLQSCPVCASRIILDQVQFAKLMLSEESGVLHRQYEQNFDPLWHIIWECPDCGYTNYYQDFAHAERYLALDVRQVIAAERDELKGLKPGGDIERIMYRYYKAIHMNQCFEQMPSLRIGYLWLSLGGLYEICQDMTMKRYCLEQALNNYRPIYSEQHEQLANKASRQRCALIIAELALEMDMNALAREYYQEVLQYPAEDLRDIAFERIRQLRKQ